jgi:hypothetical protein
MNTNDIAVAHQKAQLKTMKKTWNKFWQRMDCTNRKLNCIKSGNMFKYIWLRMMAKKFHVTRAEVSRGAG